jgi:hypothetical protein
MNIGKTITHRPFYSISSTIGNSVGTLTTNLNTSSVYREYNKVNQVTWDLKNNISNDYQYRQISKRSNK